MHVESWILERPGAPLTHAERTLPELQPGDAIVAVEACGLCHTDLAYADGSVAPKHALPLVLGHEIVGRVVEVHGDGSALRGVRVIVPAVIPCGACAFCKAGRGNACPKQKMPGNDVDGGFSTHVVVPAWALVRIDDAPASVDVRELSVVADAVSTAFQATRRARLGRGELAIVIGSGGVGAYAVQIAHALGARVVALDTDRSRLDLVAQYGTEHVVHVDDRSPKELRREVHDRARAWGIESLAFRIFECSGTPAGQALAFAMLGPAATMVQVGYSAKPVELRFSNIMAFDATIHGSWGCPPDAYHDVLRLIYSGGVRIAPFVEHAPMSRINQALDDMAHHRLSRRLVLDPHS